MSNFNTNDMDNHVFAEPDYLVGHNRNLFLLYLVGDVVTIIYYVVVKFLVIFLGCFNTATNYV